MEKNPFLKKTSTVNPYRSGISLILQRLKWDINPLSWISRKRLESYKDVYLGQKAVIVCNGPSLLNSDLTLLKNTFSFGLNKINLIFDKSSFRPSCIVAVNRFVIDQNSGFYNETDIPLFLDHYACKSIIPRNNVMFLHSVGMPIKFATDCSFSIFNGATVTFIALQLAFHFGFQYVTLIGCDHNFISTGPANATVVATGNDYNHFDKNYFANGLHWQLPDLATSEAAYSLALEVYSAFGRSLFNSTEGGSLEILPRISLYDFVNLANLPI